MPSSRSTMIDQQRYDLLSKLLDRNSRWIEVADAKAGVVIVFVSAAVAKEMGAPALGKVGRLFALLPGDLRWQTISFTAAYILILCLLGLAVMVALFQAASTLIPRLERRSAAGHLFFGDVVAHESTTFEESVLVMSADAFNRELAEQIHATATIASTKHRHVQRAIVYAVTSVPLGLLAHVLSLQF